MHLGEKLVSELRVAHSLNLLEILLILSGPDESEAVLLLEVAVDEAANLIFLLDGIGAALLFLEGVLEVLP